MSRLNAAALVALAVLGAPAHAATCEYEIRPVSYRNLVARLYVPKAEGPVPAVIAVGGSEGGLSTGEANGELIAPHCIAVLGLAYFNAQGLPPTLDGIPLEYFRNAVDYLATVPAVDASRIGMVGGSRGAELTLLFASMEPRIRSVVATTPTKVAWKGMTTSGSAWTLNGNDVPSLGLELELDAPKLKRFEAALIHEDRVRDAAIAVEKINGPILLVSATQDQVWPSFQMSIDIQARLHAQGFQFEVRHASYPTGHGFSLAFAPRIKQTIVDHFVETL